MDALFAGAEYDIQQIKNDAALEELLMREMQSPMIDKFEALVAKQPQKPLVVYDGLIYTYEAIDKLASKVAKVARTWNLRPKETVAVMMLNEPSFIYTFFGKLL